MLSTAVLCSNTKDSLLFIVSAFVHCFGSTSHECYFGLMNIEERLAAKEDQVSLRR